MSVQCYYVCLQTPGIHCVFSLSLFALHTSLHRLSFVVVVVAATLSDKVMETGVAAVLRKGQVVGRNRLPISSREYKKRRSSYTVLLEREKRGRALDMGAFYYYVLSCSACRKEQKAAANLKLGPCRWGLGGLFSAQVGLFPRKQCEPCPVSVRLFFH